MLFKRATLLLDPTAAHPENYIQNEVRYIRNAQDAIFCLSKGNYYLDNLEVINNHTGQPLVIYQDYNPIQLYQKASLEMGKPVFASMRILNPNITEVAINYQAIGGKYQNMLNVILEIKDSLDPNFTTTYPWNSVQNKPVTFNPAPHAHSFWDWTNLKVLLDSMYRVLVALYSKQKDDYHDLYGNMEALFTARAADINDRLGKLSNRIERYRNAIHYDEGDIIPSMNPEVPSNYLKYGNWVLIQDVLLMGAGYGDTVGELVGIAGKQPGDENAMRVYFWQRTDDKSSVMYTVSASKTAVDEGESVTFTISSPGRVNGTAVGWRLTGVQADDIVGQMTGTAFLNASGSTSVTVTLNADGLTDGVEFMRLEIAGDPTRFAEVEVRDASTNPTYESYFSFDELGETEITDAAEGDRVYLIVKGKNVPPIVSYVLLYEGSTMDNADFKQSLPTSVRLVDGFAAVPLDILRDKRSEGYESLVVWVSNTSSVNEAVIATRLRTYDSSLTPTYSTRVTSDLAGNVPISNINEGQSFYLHIYTTDIEDGTEITLSYSGTVTNEDFNSTPPVKATIVGGYARVRYDVRADQLSESIEYMDLYILHNGVLIGEERVLINDTSMNGAFRAWLSSNRFGTNELSWVNEGDTFYLIMSAAGYPDGAQLKLEYLGQAISSDFVDALPKTLVINSEVGFQPFTVANDRTTEGDENFIIRVKDGNNILASCNITLLDTSKEPVYTIKYTSDQLGNRTISEANEGDRIYVHVTGVNINAITTLGMDVYIGAKRATVNNNDVLEAPASTVTLVDGKGSFFIQTKADSTTEGDELIEVRLRASELSTAPVVKTATMTLRDTSKDPTWRMEFTEDEAGEVPWSNSRPLLEGETIFLQWHSENIEDGTVFWVDYPTTLPNAVLPEAFLDERPSHITVMNDRATMRYRLAAKYIEDGDEYDHKIFEVALFDNVAMTNRILFKTIQIPEPTFTAKFSGNNAGTGNLTQANEGDIIYCVLTTTNLPENALLKAEHYLNGNLITNGGTDFDNDPLLEVYVRENRAMIGVAVRNDAIPDGNKTYQVQFHPVGALPGSIPLAVANINLIDTSTGGVTQNGTYRPGTNAIGSISIGAGATKTLTLIGGGGSGVSGTMSDPVGQPYDGYDGEPTALRIGSTTLAIAGAGEGGLRGRTEATPGGVPYVNSGVLENYSQLAFETIQVPGRAASIDSSAGANGSTASDIGAGAAGSLTGTGGGSGATVTVKITNNGLALQTFGVIIGRGGMRIAGIGQQWNDGAIVVSD